MIKKTILFFAVIFLFNFLLRGVLKPNITISQAQWESNQIAAQTYLYSTTDTIENIIVGSSLSNRLRIDFLPKFYNLALGGESPREGLEIIKRKGVYPKRVFVEINVVLKENRTDFFEILDNPILSPLRRDVVVFRDGKQPLPLISALAGHYIIRRLIPENFNFSINKEAKSTNAAAKETIQNRIEADNNDNSISIPEIQSYLKDLEKHGAQIIFFEMPTENIDCDSCVEPNYRKAVNKVFPPDQYRYLPNVECGSYKTTDGLHLGSEEAIRYTHYFKQQIDSL